VLLHGLSYFCHRHSSSQLFLHESQALILLTEACQPIFDDCFDLLFRILLLVLLSFGFLMLKWLLSAWCEGVHGGHLRLGCRLFWWLSWSFGFCRCWMRLCGCLLLGACFEDLTSGPLG
jgi:hypothetical protein